MVTGGTATGCDGGFSLGGVFLLCGRYLEHCEVNNMGGMSSIGACLTYILLSVHPVERKKAIIQKVPFTLQQNSHREAEKHKSRSVCLSHSAGRVSFCNFMILFSS